MTKVAIHGAGGRMGRRLVALAHEDEQLQLVAALESSGHGLLGQDVGEVAGIGPIGVKLADTLLEEPRIVIDFSLPVAAGAVIRLCLEHRAGLVMGTTGLSAADQAALDDAAGTIPVLQAPNMSLGVNLMFAVAGQIAARLGEDYDIEIVEAHHRFKKDAPSGTALGLAEAICRASGRDMATALQHGRSGEQERKPGQIGMHALRMGDVVGRHTASFATLGEELQLTHIASNRDVFVRGALTAAKWLADKPAGRYGMKDVLGLGEEGIRH